MSDTETQSFESDYARAAASAEIARHPTSFDETEGVRIATWTSKALGASCIMHSYTHRNVFTRQREQVQENGELTERETGYGWWERRPEPHHLMHIKFDLDGRQVSMNVSIGEDKVRPHSAQFDKEEHEEPLKEIVDAMLWHRLEQIRPAAVAAVQAEFGGSVTELPVHQIPSDEPYPMSA